MRQGQDPNAKVKPPKPKQPNFHQFQFHPARLHELLEREKFAYQKAVNYVPQLDLKLPPAEAEAVKKAELQKIQNAVALTEEEVDEKERLMEEG